MIKEKKQVVSQAELDIKSSEHAVQVLNKEKTSAVNFVVNLEKQYEWIVEDKKYVFFWSSEHSAAQRMSVQSIRKGGHAV